MPAVIRPAMASDIDAIAAIYAHHVNHGTGTFETEPPDSPEMTRRWKEVEAGACRGWWQRKTAKLADMRMLLLTGPARPTGIRWKTPSMSALTGWVPDWASC